MPRTAPTIDGTPNFKKVSLRTIDVSGDKRAVSWELDLAATAAEIEALVAAYATRTNANIYSVQVQDIYNAQPLASDAVQAEENSVYDNIVILAKSATNESEELFLVAPTRASFIGDTDNPDATTLAALVTAWEATLSGTKLAVSARFTERREKNQTVPL